MEFPEVGQQCDYRDCKQLEFLPLKCKCGKVFCSEHFNKHLEFCELTISNVVTELKTIKEKYTCSHNDCKSTSIVPLLCDKCGKHFCIQHRHINDCQLPGSNLAADVTKAVLTPIQQYNDAKALVDQELDKTLATARKKSKSRETANKVQLMRIKNKAVGLKTIPVGDRIYFSIKYPSALADKTVSIFVSKTWTLGKTIDVIAQEFKIPNNNNQANSAKLRLFHADSGQIIATSMSEKMDELVTKDAITNGQSLIFEYVANDCTCLNI